MVQSPRNSTPPGTALASLPPSSLTSSRRKASSPRSALAKKDSERLEDNQQHRGEENHDRDFVEPAQPYMAPAVAPGGEIAQQPAAPEMVDDQNSYHADLGVQPAAGPAEPAEPQPQAEGDGEHGTRGHDAPVELALHQPEALERHTVLGHGVVHEQAGQVEQPREPGDHGHDVQRLDPEHGAYSANLRRAKRMASK